MSYAVASTEDNNISIKGGAVVKQQASLCKGGYIGSMQVEDSGIQLFGEVASYCWILLHDMMVRLEDLGLFAQGMGDDLVVGECLNAEG